MLQRFHKPGGELKKTRILDLLDQEWRKDDFDYEVREMKFKEQGIKILSQYVDYVLSDPPKYWRGK